MQKYTILTFLFGNYDILREPKVIDPNVEYICITDKPVKSKCWKVHIDAYLSSKSPIYASYYVRHHPFEYSNTDITIVIDASIQLNDSISDIVKRFIDTNSDYSIMSTAFETDEQKIEKWTEAIKCQPYRFTPEDAISLYMFIKKLGQENWKGSIGTAVIFYKKSYITRKFSKHVWRYLLATGHNGNPNRIDEIIVHKLLYNYKDAINIFNFSLQFIYSSYMTYCRHGLPEPVTPKKDYDQFYYICNEPVYPYRFDKRVLYPTSYKYKTEAILLTKYLNPADLKEWLDHHLYVCKFDKVHIFDNESNYDVQAICKNYGNRVTYDLIEGQAYQYRLYDSYIECRSNAEWIIPLDDDEYLDIGKFDSVYEGLMYYRHKFLHMNMLAVRWKHMFPKRFHSERTGKVLDYCTEENPELAKMFMPIGDGTVKTFVRRYGKIHYEETWENPHGGHIPKNSVFLGAMLPDGKSILEMGIINPPNTLEDEYMRIIHCRYKGYSEYKKKMQEVVTVSDAIPRKKHFKFDDILEILD